MSHALARKIIAQAQARLAKHFSGEPGYELDKETIQKLQRDIEQAEMHLEDDDEKEIPYYPI